MMWVVVMFAGALGATARYLLDHAVTIRTSGRMPWGTWLVNVTGSLAAGALAGLVTSGVLPPGWHTVVAGGFLGAYTTFSTAMHETLLLAEDGRRQRAGAHLLVQALVTAGAATIGWWIVAS